MASLAEFDVSLTNEINAMWCVFPEPTSLLNAGKLSVLKTHITIFCPVRRGRLMLGAILVFFMQTGFAMVEVGSVAAKNTRNILLKVAAPRDALAACCSAASHQSRARQSHSPLASA